jgi:predicted dehydrogenase
MDAVVLANYFHEHAPFAIKALEAGKHVMSECAACSTLAEGVELCRTVEQTGKIYMLAENYPFTAFNLELARLYKQGEIGRVLYAEGEYIHPGSFDWAMGISPGLRHWRNNLPATYYCTHAMAPLMTITDTMPVRVNGFAPPLPEDSARPRLWRQRDAAGVVVAQMDNGAIFRLIQGGLPGHSIFYRLHGEWGLLELGRGPGYWGPGSVRIVHDEFDLRPGQVAETSYYPRFPEWAQAATQAGHGGGDFFTTYHFARAIRSEEAPFWDVYRGVACSIVGILAYRSALAGSNTVEVPDLRQKTVRDRYRDDHWSPDPATRQDGDPWPSVLGDLRPSAEGLAYAREVWRAMGYVERGAVASGAGD